LPITKISNAISISNLKSIHWENAKLKCSKISTFQNHEIKMQQKYNGLQYKMSFDGGQLPLDFRNCGT